MISPSPESSLSRGGVAWQGVKRERCRRGFSLVEVTMAIGVVSFCLVAMLGLLPVGLSQERKSADQMRTLQALEAVMADIQNAPAGASATGFYAIALPVLGGQGQQGRLELSDSFAPAAGAADKQYEVIYRVEPPATRFSTYRFSIRAVRSTMAEVSQKLDSAGLDYVESVLLKPAL